MSNIKRLVAFILLLSTFSSLYALEHEQQSNKANKPSHVITIETATIRGNQELPTVLYLVPWQPPEVHALDETQTADIIAPNIELIDRGSFKRLLDYHQSRSN